MERFLSVVARPLSRTRLTSRRARSSWAGIAATACVAAAWGLLPAPGFVPRLAGQEPGAVDPPGTASKADGAEIPVTRLSADEWERARRLFATENLVAWCIVPFDDRVRTPAERAEMLGRLGLRRYAYDYRAEHIPTFDAEMRAIGEAGIELVAWWFPQRMTDEARGILDVLRRHGVRTQLWVTGGGAEVTSEEAYRRRVREEAERIRPIAEAAAEIGCRVSLYNHGGWFGEPENQIAIIRELGLDNVGIVYNLHHGHDHLERFEGLLQTMLPHLDALNLNGMVAGGDRSGQKILPIGQGTWDGDLIRTIVRSGYDGPIGILNHTQENAERRLAENVAGLRAILDGLRPDGAGASEAGAGEAGASEAAEVPDLGVILDRARGFGDAARGLAVFASAEFACLNCHRVAGHGGRVGPDLSDLRRRREAAHIVESVYRPSREIDPEYRAIAVATDDGRVIRGYPVRRTESELVIRDPAEEIEYRVANEEIEFEQPIGSLMPDGLTAAMTPRQQIDLVRFLLSLGDPDQALDERTLAATLRHARGHVHGPATFPLNPSPLDPELRPGHRHPVNRDRIYDFYTKQANHFRGADPPPVLLEPFPGLDGPAHGHWGNQNDETWRDGRWNATRLDVAQAGVFRYGRATIPRALCVRLSDGDGGQRYLCFDRDRLRYEVQWRDRFLAFSDVRSGLMHAMSAGGELEPVPESMGLPEEMRGKALRYRGHYRHGDRILIAYTVDGVAYLDAPEIRDGRLVRNTAPAETHPLRGLTQGGPPRWPERLDVPIELGEASTGSDVEPSGSGAGSLGYAIDTIAVPSGEQNPWQALIYVGGLAFHPDGSAYVCSIHGDVWRVSGFDYPSRRAVWQRFASGLQQPLGMVIDGNGIFVLGRDQITRLHDLNGNGEADFYECYSDAFETSPAGHDYICGLGRDGDGYFYTASGNQGLLRISPDGSAAEVLATGFRNPDGLGLDADGTVTVPMSEGEWTPASMIAAVTPGKPRRLVSAGRVIGDGTPPHFGYRGPRDAVPPALPMVYLPRGLDNSAGGQVRADSDRWGPLSGQLIHFSYGAATHFLLLRDEVGGVIQGGVVPLEGEFRSGAHRGAVRPQDGQLYVGGAAGWGTYAIDDGSFQRVRYTGRPVQTPVGFHPHRGGVVVRFVEVLGEDVTDPRLHFAQAWNYRYGPGYGSPEYSTRHPETPGHDPLTIRAAHRSADGKALFLEIPELQPVNQLHLSLTVSPDRRCELFLTLHALDPGLPEGFSLSEAALAEWELFPEAAHPILADMARLTPARPNPWGEPSEATLGGPFDADRIREVRIRCTGHLTFDTPSFRASPNEILRIVLVNPDVVPHNWALVRPGALAAVGELTNRLIADPDAVSRHYVPDSPDVVAYTDIVPPGEEFAITIRVPAAPGRYPYLCTFPGHWPVMNGEMIVE